MSSELITTAVVMLSFSVASYAEDAWEEIEGHVVASTSCDQPEAFQRLFKLSLSGKFTGVADSELLAEANEVSLINCPKQFLLELMKLPKDDQEEVFRYFGTKPPWEIAKALSTLRSDKEVGELIKSEFSGFFEVEEPREAE